MRKQKSNVMYGKIYLFGAVGVLGAAIYAVLHGRVIYSFLLLIMVQLFLILMEMQFK